MSNQSTIHSCAAPASFLERVVLNSGEERCQKRALVLRNLGCQDEEKEELGNISDVAAPLWVHLGCVESALGVQTHRQAGFRVLPFYLLHRAP